MKLENTVSELHIFHYDSATPEASLAPADLSQLPGRKAGDTGSVIPHDSSSGTDDQAPAKLLARQPQCYFEIKIGYSPETGDIENRAGELKELNLICECPRTQSTDFQPVDTGAPFNHQLLGLSEQRHT